MKKYIAFIFLMICMLSLAGCSKTTEEKPRAEEQAGIKKEIQTEEPPQETVTEVLRIVDGADTGNLILAGENAGDLYVLHVGDLPIYLDGEPAEASVLEDGMMAEITYDGSVEESYPMGFGNVSSVSVDSFGMGKNPAGTFHDLCGLYLQVLNDLWEKDSGLNGGAAYVSVDLSQAPGELTEGEKSAIAWIFAGEHGAEELTFTYEELAQQGYLTEVDLGDDSEDMPKLYEWKEGVLFSITGDSEKELSLPAIKFDAQKWRSPLGAYYFMDCEAVWSEKGRWKDYSIGGEAIS